MAGYFPGPARGGDEVQIGFMDISHQRGLQSACSGITEEVLNFWTPCWVELRAQPVFFERPVMPVAQGYLDLGGLCVNSVCIRRDAGSGLGVGNA